ncbi:MAG TPA: hypothetical protein VHE33_13200 [Acidobacteriaceae bacterium]|nr:hypothetical protein [Acidobacteriaceae bacterium]
MDGIRIFRWALGLLVLTGAALASGQELTPDAAKAMLDQQGAATNASDFTLSQEQAHALTALSPDLLASLQIETNQPCLPNPGDKRVLRHQFAACQGIFPAGISDQNPGVYLKVGRAFHWHIVEISGIVDPTEDHTQRLVGYTWEYDFSGLPAEVQKVLSQGSRHEGHSLFQLDGGTWKWLRYQ